MNRYRGGLVARAAASRCSVAPLLRYDTPPFRPNPFSPLKIQGFLTTAVWVLFFRNHFRVVLFLAVGSAVTALSLSCLSLSVRTSVNTRLGSRRAVMLSPKQLATGAR